MDNYKETTASKSSDESLGVNSDALGKHNWKPIIPNHVNHSYVKGYIYGMYVFGFTAFFLLITGAHRSFDVMRSFIYAEAVNILSGTISHILFLLIFLIFIAILIVLHEIIHIVCLPKFWIKGNVKVNVSISKGIYVHNANMILTRNRVLLTVSSSFLLMSVVFFLLSFFTNREIMSHLLIITATVNFIVSAFDLRTIFYLLKLPQSVMICNGNYCEVSKL